MKKIFSKSAFAGAFFLMLATAAIAHAAVWRADLEVTIAATKGAQSITYTMTVTNLADDTARDVILSHAPTYSDNVNGMSVVSVVPTSPDVACTSTLQNNHMPSVKCTVGNLQVGEMETITVTVTNPGNPARTGTVQAMGITPDPKPANNFASVTVP